MAAIGVVFAVGLALGWGGRGIFGLLSTPPKDYFHREFFPRTPEEFPKRQETDQALARAQSTLEADPADLSALMASGIIYFGLGQEHAAQAINLFEAARDYGAADERLFYYLGRLYYLIGLGQFSIPEYERFLRHRPKDRTALLELAKIQFEQGRYAESVRLYENLLALNGKKRRDPVILENVALSALNLQEWEKAQSFFEELRKDSKNYPKETSYFLAEAVRRSGDCAKAIPLYDEALEASLEPHQKLAVFEGQLHCLKESSPPDQERILNVAGEILKLDSKNSLARGAQRQFKVKSRRKN